MYPKLGNVTAMASSITKRIRKLGKVTFFTITIIIFIRRFYSVDRNIISEKELHVFKSENISNYKDVLSEKKQDKKNVMTSLVINEYFILG